MCSWASWSRPGPRPSPSSPFPELADRAVCTALGRTFQAVLTGRPALLPNFNKHRQTTTIRLSPWGWHRSPWRWGAWIACGRGSRCGPSKQGQLHKQEEAARGAAGLPGAAGLRAKAAASASAESGSPLPGQGEVAMAGNSLECGSALCDSHGCGPRATSRQMGKFAFLYEHEKIL